MQETTTSYRTGVRPWLVSILLLLALVGGGGAGAWLVQTHQPSQSAGGPACPSSAQNVTWPSRPTQVVRYNPPSTAPAPLILQPSQTLELDLFGPWIWRQDSPAVSPTLTLEAPAGYLDAGGQDCVWHFTARQVGREPLHFSGKGMCQGTAETCMVFDFNLAVTVAAGTQV